MGSKSAAYDLLPRAQNLARLLQSCISDRTHRSRFPPIHAQSVVAGLESDLFLNNLLLNGYSKAGRLREARQLFDRMPRTNLISWSTMIAMCAQHGREGEAITLFSRFRRSSFRCPNEFILASVLRACVQMCADSFACQVQDLVVKTGFCSDVFVGTALINFYAKIGCMDEAMLIFDELPVRNSVTWTAVITGYSQVGNSWMSLELFDEMRESGVQPDRFVLSSVISACSTEHFLEGGRQIHGHLYRSGIDMDISINNVLIDLYCKCDRVRTARGLFDRMCIRNLVSWTTMIAGYMQNSLDSEAIDLFSEMTQLGWQADGFACTSVLSSCGSMMALLQGKQVHGYAIKANLDANQYVKNGLLGYARHEKLVEAVSLFNRMRSGTLNPNLLTLVSLLGVSASSSAVDLSKQFHSLMIKFGAALNLFAGSALVDVYSKCAFVDDARAIFDEMEDKDLVVWNAMIYGYTQNGQGEEALKLFHQLQVCGLTPTEFTFVALVTVASNLASLFHGLQFHNLIIKAGVDLDPHVSNALVDMYAKCGCINEAWRLFDSTRGRDVVCWNSMISRYAQHGHAEEALKIFQLMRDEEIEPNYVTFVGVLSACSHAGLVEEGLHHFYSMRDKCGVVPGIEHYASVVSLLGRAGKVHEAKEFIEQMPIEPAAIIWRSLLSACQVSGDVELGKYAAEMAITANPKDSGPYVLLSNIFASKGMWVDAEKVRKGMNCSLASKEPGYSWIEVMKEIHVFIARGREHRQADLIYFMLDGLTKVIKDVGYVPDITLLSTTDGND
ncbi:PPR repeat [Musa troglodytarum]|uniref:PPR repeat n=1 Tax=Musa troglodytarum TaxID=320322 RepID=A0A9E7EE40_9LILI|nr:PPR repeat [Musa troglodytarum]